MNETRPCGNHAPDLQSPSIEFDLRTDDGLRGVLRVVDEFRSWDVPAGQQLLAEVRRGAVRNAAQVASSTGAVLGRGLVDDVLLAARMVLHRHTEKVLTAARPWAYLMSSAQRQVLDEIRAQQLLTNNASIRGRARVALPRSVRPVGSTATDLATALRHESRVGDPGRDTAGSVRQVRQHEQRPLVVASSDTARSVLLGEREPWFTAFINLLVRHGADQHVAVAAVDRLAGVTVLLSSHQLDLVEGLCEDVVIIDHGRVVMSGQVDELRMKAAHRTLSLTVRGAAAGWLPDVPGMELVLIDNGTARLRVRRDTDLAEVIRIVREAGEVTAMSYEPPGLSELFRQAVQA